MPWQPTLQNVEKETQDIVRLYQNIYIYIVLVNDLHFEVILGVYLMAYFLKTNTKTDFLVVTMATKLFQNYQTISNYTLKSADSFLDLDC